jgi:hypothetical protein
MSAVGSIDVLSVVVTGEEEEGNGDDDVLDVGNTLLCSSGCNICTSTLFFLRSIQYSSRKWYVSR